MKPQSTSLVFPELKHIFKFEMEIFLQEYDMITIVVTKQTDDYSVFTPCEGNTMMPYKELWVDVWTMSSQSQT